MRLFLSRRDFTTILVVGVFRSGRRFRGRHLYEQCCREIGHTIFLVYGGVFGRERSWIY